jgi:hypothetical protein
MGDFLDVQGASGTPYRFRRIAPAELPATAGNVLVAAGNGSRPKVLFCGSTRSLAQAAPRIAETLKAAKSAQLFVRLNVARAVREAEYADILAALAPETQTGELD